MANDTGQLYCGIDQFSTSARGKQMFLVKVGKTTRDPRQRLGESYKNAVLVATSRFVGGVSEYESALLRWIVGRFGDPAKGRETFILTQREVSEVVALVDAAGGPRWLADG